MANFIVSYDLNGSSPSHEEMDEHVRFVASRSGRLLESVWWVSYWGSAAQLRDQLKVILGSEDLLLVAEARDAAWTSLLVDHHGFVEAWHAAA
ncbi:hypothetical protein [Hyphomicrobium sp. D-2]|uniref:hypothetical protein n=1 Tax=Hyphomicrobium sp. D-2 TaxID=3041621 RepID=UPI002456EFB4|nr:hypothetical protein [Hyphomicrobium sp. D-2]MDH4983499.1 hypothetical protein [Hyphomicrobium sp. D-2]